MDAAEYKHVVLGLIFLKYISDTFEEHHAKLLTGKGDYAGANAEDPDEYKAENVFWVPAEARWSPSRACGTSAKQPTMARPWTTPLSPSCATGILRGQFLTIDKSWDLPIIWSHGTQAEIAVGGSQLPCDGAW
jgi:HsdM N-terminal domain